MNDTYYKKKNVISIWPHPATDYITINPGEQTYSALTYVSILDLSGRELIKIPFNEQIDISSLKDGIYIVITSFNGRAIGYNRLIKIR